MQLHRSVFGAARTAIDGAVAWGEMAVDDLVHPRRTLDGNELDAWDPDYIRRVLPLWRATLCNYFRAEVHGLDNIPSSGPSLLVGNHSGGTYIVDTFILATEFYAHFGPERRSHQLAHDIAARLPATAESLGNRGRLTRDRPEGLRQRCPCARLSGRRLGDVPAQLALGPDRVRRAQGIHQVSPRERRADRAGRSDRRSGNRAVRHSRRARRQGHWLGQAHADQGLPVAFGPPFGATVLDLPGRLPLPAKITVEVRQPIDLVERFGPRPEPENVYETITGEMQDRLSELQEERTLPIIG